MTEDVAGLARPPIGALAGECVPVENVRDDLERATIDEVVGLLKTKSAYHDMTEKELREIAREKSVRYSK